MTASETSTNKVRETYNDYETNDDFTADEHPLYSNVSRFMVRDGPRSRPYQLATISLGILSAVLLAIMIGLSVRINRVSDDHNSLSLNTSRINSELAQLKSDHKSLIESKKALQDKHDEDTKQIKSLQTNLATETRLKNELQSQNRDLREEKRKLKSQLTNLEENCGQCLPHWLLMNNTCYFFAVSEAIPRKGWAAGRQECTKKGADLLVINSKEEQEFISDTLRAMKYNLQFNYRNGFWMGLKDDHTEGVWKWLHGTNMTEGNWMDGEPNDEYGIEDCAAVYPTNNPMKSWNDVPCAHPLKWICEKEITKTP
ncbi:C-type lectin domain family 4 member E-like [Colossoma macropomum]|uniref:C-type lectin domain family 4 member E-like n=1 Tax=Colossoma macropomum TaxID=42526 RepID=UPI001863D457|nr:C-type lectin domain family 4 member E-like [Colossoma macropomum]